MGVEQIAAGNAADTDVAMTGAMLQRVVLKTAETPKAPTWSKTDCCWTCILQSDDADQADETSCWKGC